MLLVRSVAHEETDFIMATMVAILYWNCPPWFCYSFASIISSYADINQRNQVVYHQTTNQRRPQVLSIKIIHQSSEVFISLPSFSRFISTCISMEMKRLKSCAMSHMICQTNLILAINEHNCKKTLCSNTLLYNLICF